MICVSAGRDRIDLVVLAGRVGRAVGRNTVPVGVVVVAVGSAVGRDELPGVVVDVGVALGVLPGVADVVFRRPDDAGGRHLIQAVVGVGLVDPDEVVVDRQAGSPAW